MTAKSQNQIIRSTFHKVSSLIRSSPPTDVDGKPIHIPDSTRLKLYGYYKVATSSNGETMGSSRPSMFDPVGRAKYDAWMACRSECDEEDVVAMRKYLEIAACQDNVVGRECDKIYGEMLRQLEVDSGGDRSDDEVETTNENEGTSKDMNESGADPRNANQADTSSRVQCNATKTQSSNNTTSIFQRISPSSFLPSPLLPRGQLDISIIDLFYALYQCLQTVLYHVCFAIYNQSTRILPSFMVTLLGVFYGRFHPMQRGRYFENQIVEWTTKRNEYHRSSMMNTNETTQRCIDAVVGLSVRSLLDLYLSVRSFPSGSQVIIVPGISIQGMLDVMTYHDLMLVPVDLPWNEEEEEEMCHSKWGIDLDGVKAAMTERTVAILVVHPFGALIANNDVMKELRDVADEQSVEIWEDCAQCFDGESTGSAFSDVSFLSFGPIKTATALGGGVAVMRNAGGMRNAEAMKRLQDSLYTQQSNLAFFQRVIKCTVLHLLSYSRFSCGAIKTAIEFFGWDYNEFVVSALRGFSAGNNKQLMKQLRRRPCPALLALIYRRLTHSSSTLKASTFRKKRCQSFEKLLVNELPGKVVLPHHTDGSSMNGWIFPILVEEPQLVSKALLDAGIDAPCGLTQLKPVSSNCHRLSKTFEHILYLPVTSNNFSSNDHNRLIDALKNAVEKGKLQREPRKSLSTQKVQHRAIILSATLFQWYFLDLHHPSVKLIFIVIFTLIKWILLASSCILMLLVVLSRYMGPIYLESSNTFAKYCDMLFKSPFNNDTTSDVTFQQSQTVLALESTQIPEAHFNKDDAQMCLVTGATGFIGSLLLRELLLHRNSLGLDGVVVIVRAKRGKNAEERMRGILSQDMFDFLSGDEKTSLVRVIEGDVTLPDCGLAQLQLAAIRQLNVSRVFHCAAAVSFQQPLEQAAISNITSSLQMQKLTKDLWKNATFVYISTAFVHGDKTGTKSKPLPESLFPLDPYDPFEIYKSMLETQSYASAAMNKLGFPNTYTFSKCICEHLLHSDQSINTMIIRPSIVGPSAQEPFEGWAGEKPSTIVAAACLYLKFPYNMWCFGKELVPFIPADVVCRFVISKAFNASKVLQDECTADFAEEKKEVNLDDNNSECERHTTISTVAWDASSSTQSSFSWIGYAFAITHLGSVCGHVNRVVAYAGLLLSTIIFPWFDFPIATFRRLHSMIARAPFDALLNLCNRISSKSTFTRNLKALSPLLDLPMLFFPFANQDFFFQSGLVAPSDFNGERYMFSCAVAAHHFIAGIEKKRFQTDKSKRNLVVCPKSNVSTVVLAGSNHSKPVSDLVWALTQPKGNIFIRIGAWTLSKIFRRTAHQIEVDASSFVQMARTLSLSLPSSRPHVIIAPTHRSFYDFLVISYICFSYPELGIDMPFIAAADDFKKIPIVGWLACRARAFFIKRGGNRIDPDLGRELNRISKCTNSPVFIEVFVEGKRSRYRTFSPAKTGFLRCLAESGQQYFILPLTINYEALPDQTSLIQQASYDTSKSMSLKSLMHWLYRALFLGNVNIGRIHISASGGLEMPDSTAINSLCQSIQHRQQSRIMVSDYHVQAASLSLSVPTEVMTEALKDLGVAVWPLFGAVTNLSLPTSRDMQWAAMLHFGHAFAPFLASSHTLWSAWLSGSVSELRAPDNVSKAVGIVIERLIEHFDAVESAIEKAVAALKLSGFPDPDESHIVQYIPESSTLPLFLMRVAIQARQPSPKLACKTSTMTKSALITEPLFKPTASSNPDSESLGAWGFQDSYFVLNIGSNGSKDVIMKGERYSISGKKLPELASFVEEQLRVKINPNRLTFPSTAELDLPATEFDRFASEVASIFANGANQVSISPHDRARHGTGHTQEDIYGLRSGSLRVRLPDAVVWPENMDEIAALVSTAATINWCLIPFGGGTNVTHATHCPDKEVDPRPMISVDMKSMNRIIWVNKEDGLAHVEAGITGRELISQMENLGLTIGHEPDSYEFSTLGGWIATKASGMKQNRYGNIEDIVKEVTVVGANGVISNVHSSIGRVSAGLDFKSIMLGSEGGLGIIVSAVIKVWPIAETTSYESVLLPDIDAGLRFVKAISKMRLMKPASVRLLDNDQFRLGQALKPEASRLEHVKQIISKQIGFIYGNLSEKSAVCATITFEGSHLEVQMQKKAVRDIATSHCGILAGSSVGRAGYDLTFAIAYLRDFALNYSILGESFETFVPWSKVKHLIEKTKKRIQSEHRKLSLPGVPFVCSRVTQIYDEGACVYFYFCLDISGVVDPSKMFASIEECARQEILDAGGSLSHHHGIGKLRAPFVRQVYSDEYVNSIVAIKKALDPNNIFGVRNGVLSSKEE